MPADSGELATEAVIYTFAFLWATVLALVAVGGGLWVAVALAVAGGALLAWVREHV